MRESELHVTAGRWMGLALAIAVSGLLPGVFSARAQAPVPAPKVAGKPVHAAHEASAVWGALMPSEQAALRPLQDTWATLSEAQKRKWIKVSAGFSTLPEAEQTILHARMRDWAALTPEQRATARLNFSTTQTIGANLSTEKKQQKWQEYNELDTKERQKFKQEAKSAAPAKSAALAAKLQNRLKEAPQPHSALHSSQGLRVPEASERSN